MSDIIEGELSVPTERGLSTPARHTENVANMLATALDRGMSPEALEKLVMLQERVMAKQAEAEFNAALLDFQGDCPIIGKSRTVDTGKYSYDYAELSHIVHAVRPLLKAYGLSFSFDSDMDSGKVTVRCIISHVGGHSKVTTFSAPVDTSARMNDTQKVASAITYARRYALVLALGLTIGEDDDGRALGNGGPPEQPLPPRNKSAPRSEPRGQRAPVPHSVVANIFRGWQQFVAPGCKDLAEFQSWVAFATDRDFAFDAKVAGTDHMTYWTSEDVRRCHVALAAAEQEATEQSGPKQGE